MENFSYPIKLEPLNRPVKRRVVRPHPSPAAAPAAPPVAKRRKKSARKQLGLREQREHHGVSLEEIAENTRIPLRHLEELERGDIENWPTGVYAKSWARDYAKHAGIDPERAVAIVAPIADVEPTIDEIKQVREERERTAADGEFPLGALVNLMRRFAAIILVVALIAVAVILFFWTADSRPADSKEPAPIGTSGTTPGQSPR